MLTGGRQLAQMIGGAPTGLRMLALPVVLAVIVRQAAALILA